jgi:hypothetical protein
VAREAHLVGDDDHGLAAGGERAQRLQHLLRQLGVEGGGRLVEEEDLGLHRERARDGDPLLLSAGELRRPRAGAGGEADPVEQGLRARLRVGARESQHVVGRESDVLRRRQVGEEVVALEDESDLLTQAAQQRDVEAGRRVDRDVADLDPTRRERRQAVEAAQQRRLARARRSDQRQHVAARDGQVDVVEARARLAEQPQSDRADHPVPNLRSRWRASRVSG